MSAIAKASRLARRAACSNNGAGLRSARRWNSSAANSSSTPSASPRASPSASLPSSSSSPGSSRSSPAPAVLSPARAARKRRVLWSLVAFGSVGFLFPFYLWFQNNTHHYTGSAPLTPAQRIRGAYINSSSTDIGPDPAWQKSFGIQRVEADDFAEQQHKQQQAATAAAAQKK